MKRNNYIVLMQAYTSDLGNEQQNVIDFLTNLILDTAIPSFYWCIYTIFLLYNEMKMQPLF